MAPVLKTGIRETVSGVRIPHSPPCPRRVPSQLRSGFRLRAPAPQRALRSAGHMCSPTLHASVGESVAIIDRTPSECGFHFRTMAHIAVTTDGRLVGRRPRFRFKSYDINHLPRKQSPHGGASSFLVADASALRRFRDEDAGGKFEPSPISVPNSQVRSRSPIMKSKPRSPN